MKSKQKNFPIDWGINQLNSFSVSEGFKKAWKIPHLLLNHPPTPQVWKKQKKTCCFLGFLAHLEQKIFFKSFFTLQPTTATHWSHQLPPPITTTNYWCTPLPTPTTATHHGEWCSGRCLWLVASVVVGSGGCQRWWVGGVGWQWWVMVATVVLGCNSRCGHRVLLDSVSGLTHPSLER